MTDPRLTPLAARLPATVPFVGPEAQERSTGATFAARLGANENAFGPSPKAIAAMEGASSDIWMYADPESHDLRHALAAHHNIPADCIMVGEGIDGLLGYLVRLFVGEGDRVVTSDGAYPTFNYHVAGFGGVVEKVPYRDDHEDPIALMQRANEVDAKLVYLANPDNPMGTWHSADMINNAITQTPKNALLILDEAYVEFAPEGTAPAIDPTDNRVIRMRTFSKAYGMAGGRVGYAISTPEIIMAFNKVRNHFGMNRAAQIGSLEALKDQAHLFSTLENVTEARQRIRSIAQDNGLTCVPSATNFVAIDCGGDGAFAKRVLTELVARGIFVRMPFVAPQDRCIRASAGSEQQLSAFEAALPEALNAARS
ncbi:pyridoxal phosphate-dependent aminotransferase [Cochlodiniinecator piscidefendens]|uniref:pyridoxal phosphate-dependent aminotransferase n=1 Tax=Cochlodiniinecator piscidefendens TaxID=2715756 RepID=UPI00140CD8E0|nr:pyridoxal phosphate-dependent aminotransferase [Cochlodiniinecator piscidefendens]